jgi:hypothetical protein
LLAKALTSGVVGAVARLLEQGDEFLVSFVRFLDEILALDQLVAHDSRLRVDVKPTNRIHFPTLRSVLSKRLVGGH